MNANTIASMKIALAGALIGLLVVSYLFEKAAGRRGRRGLAAGFTVVALLAVLGYFNFGSFRFQKGGRFVHAHEQFHFYFGSAYLDAVRYDGLYLATALAAQEDNEHHGEWQTRDPLTRGFRPLAFHPKDAEAIKRRFDPERWRDFKHDRRFFFHDLGLGPSVLYDHANTGSPSWAMLAALLTRPLGIGRAQSTLYAMLDVLLLAMLFATVWRWLGARVASIAMVVGLLPPAVYDYLGGSLLRLDWLVALGLAACCFATGRYKTAGVLLGYAVSSKIFCGLVALGLGVGMGAEAWRTGRPRREHVALVLSAFAGLGLSVGLSSLYFGGIGIWADYWERIVATYHAEYYARNYSFRDLFLQAVYGGLSVLDPSPSRVWASEAGVNIRDHAFSFWIARIVAAGALVLTIVRHEALFGLGIGVLLVFVVLVTNLYYWQMLLLIALVCAGRYREDPRKLACLLLICLWLVAQYAFVPLGPILSRGYFGSYGLALVCVGILLVEVSAFAMRRDYER